jgi:hypothetical protein
LARLGLNHLPDFHFPWQDIGETSDGSNLHLVFAII